MKEREQIYGVDLAKSVFQVHGTDASGIISVRKKLKRAEFQGYFVNIPRSVIAMEACGGSHHWGRKFSEMGHEVRLISPQFVKPYVKSNKNDRADAEAIAEAATRPGMRFVAVKQLWQQDILFFHRVRERLVRNRTALMNEIRGLLQEYGKVFPQGARSLRSGLVELIGSSSCGLSDAVCSALWGFNEEWAFLEKRIAECEKRISDFYRSNSVCERLGTIPGVGEITATAIVATIGNTQVFRSGREFAASLGLVPRQCSSGGKSLLLGISKRGDKYIRKLLVHGARNVLRYAERKKDRRSQWIVGKMQTRGFNKTCVALANKNARICWALMKYGTTYKN